MAKTPWHLPSIYDLLNMIWPKEEAKKTIWSDVLGKKVPDDLAGKIDYYVCLTTQMVVSSFTESAGMAAFLLEESVQAVGMGAYLLYVAKDWETLDTYLGIYNTILSGSSNACVGLATLNPIIGGASLIYMSSATEAYNGLLKAVEAQVKTQARGLGIKIEETDTTKDLLLKIKIAEAEKIADAILKAQTMGTLALKSVPSNADIYMDGKSLGLQTPETFKELAEGPHDVAVSKYNTKTKKTDSYAATIEIIAGKKKEVTLHLIIGTSDDLVNPDGTEKKDTPQLPDFIKTTVLCVKMIDGDTFETNTGEKIRILGMDAPETGQPIAQTSKDFMASKLLDHKIDIRIQTYLPIDTYGRTLAIATYRDENVAVSSIANGLAKALIFNDATYDPSRYLEAERLAKERKIGIWDPATPPIIWRGG
jgi:endonuclease YncB( thermonuclease family)